MLSPPASRLHDSGTLAGQPDRPFLMGQTLFFTAFEPTTGRELWKRELDTSRLERVKDIQPGSQGSDPRPLISTNGVLLFTANDGRNGTGLWRSDGTEAGTVRIQKLCPGAIEPTPPAFTSMDGTLFFLGRGCTDTRGALWKSDGTEEGTELIKGGLGRDVYNMLPTALTAWKGELYFAAIDPTPPEREGLWKTDGTPSGTVFLKSGLPMAFPVIGETLYFLSRENVWLGRTDGTPEGTAYLKFLTARAFSAAAYGFTMLNGALYFGIRDHYGSAGLWRTDGTAEGTVQVSPKGFGAHYTLGSTLVLVDHRTTDTQSALWVGDGTAEGTVLLMPFPNGIDSSPEPALAGGALYFAVNDGANGHELWRTDGTLEGTLRLASFPGKIQEPFTTMSGTLYFAADEGATGRELWRTDGTVAGTARVKDLHPGAPSSNVRWLLPNGEGKLLFFAEDAASTGLWTSDGTETGTRMLERLGTLDQGTRDDQLVDVNGTLYLASSDRTAGNELWKTDGTAEGMALVKDLHPGAGSSSPMPRFATDSLLFFTADDGAKGRQLWRSDGTQAGTFPLAGNNKVPCEEPILRTLVNGTLYFTVRYAADFYCVSPALWKSDGTPEGTIRVGDIDTDPARSPGFFTPMNGEVYFAGTDGSLFGSELMKTSGRFIQRVKDIWPGSEGSSPRELVVVDGVLYFAANDGVSGAELWRSDGTEQGTLRVADIRPGAEGSAPAHLRAANGVLYFVADDGTTGRELWRSDGTAAGTVRVKDVRPGIGSSSIDLLTPMNGALYFVADDGDTGLELWKSDGTEEGTVQLADIAPGPAAGLAPAMSLLALEPQGRLLFAADDGRSGAELWISGEAPGDVRQVMDLAPGADGSWPRSLTVSGERVFFLADSEGIRWDPWSVGIAELPDPSATCRANATQR